MAIDDACKLFVAGLPDAITEDVLRQLFEATGANVADVSLPRDRATGRPRGFGFVTLSSEDEAERAREALDGSMQSGRSISVRPFQSGPPKKGDGPRRPGARPDREARGRGAADNRGGDSGGDDDRTLYLGNLPYEIGVPELQAFLEEAGVGPVLRVNLPQDGQGRARGFGFVTLSSASVARDALGSLEGAELGGRKLSANIARGRGARPARTEPPVGRSNHGPGPPAAGVPRSTITTRSAEARPGGAPAAPFHERETFDEPRRASNGGERRRKEPKKKKKTKGGGERSRMRREMEQRGRRGRSWWPDDD